MSTEYMRKLITLFESEYVGPSDDPNVSYTTDTKKGEITKITAKLASTSSAKYTRLAKNVKKISELKAEIDELEKQTKQDARETIDSLFHAKDSVYTRVVETAQFTLKLTAEPKPTTTVKYESVLKELTNHLTPELISIMEDLKKKFSSEVKKSAALTITEDDMPDIDPYAEYYGKILNWGKKYDKVLDKMEKLVD